MLQFARIFPKWYFIRTMATARNKVFRIYRYAAGKKPYMQDYTVDLNSCGKMVLDALLKIKSEQDSTLCFRRSCREGVCGSCALNVDGTNQLACLSRIKSASKSVLYPLPHMYVIRDLIVDFDQFIQQYNRIKPYLIRARPEKMGTKQFLQSMKDRDGLDGHIECILCACCATSCPEYWWHGHTSHGEDFLGPASLLNAWRWIKDSRDQAPSERLSILRNYHAVYRCHQIMNCANVCPKNLNPGKAIAELRLMLGGLKSKPPSELDGTAEICHCSPD